VSATWTLTASHGIVLFYLAARPESTIREMSEELDLTQRRIAQIVHDLAEANLIKVTRSGRRNLYRVNPEGHFRHPTLSHITVGRFIEALQSVE